MPADFYELLEVDSDADADDIKRAYREKARQYHPDVNDDPRARDQFTTLNAARDVLSNPKDRARYDRLGHAAYVRQHMDGLPRLSRPGQDDRSDDATDGLTEPTATDGPTADAGRDATSETETTAADDRSTATTAADGASTTATGSTSTSTRGSASGTDRTRSSRNASGGAQATASGETTNARNRGDKRAGGDARSERNARTETARTPRSGAAATPTAGTARRAALKRGWLAVAVGLALYVGGIVGYALAARESVAATIDRLTGDPVAALAARSSLADPTAVVYASSTDLAVGVSNPGALLAVGAVALPLAVSITVAKFGRGLAVVYVLGTAALLAWAPLRPVVPASLGADLLAVAVPALTAVWFLADVGRYLRA